jgi:DNA repair exonuclease SbcCD nuclease subunit
VIKVLGGIGDIHLRKKNFFEVGFKKFTNWLDETFPDEMRENTEIFLAGDVFDKTTLLPDVAAMAVELSNLLFKKAKTVYVILGNHDYGLHKYKIVNTKKFLQELHFTVIDDLSVITTNLGFKVLCLPWVYGATFKKINEFISTVEDQQFDAVLSHWELESMFGNNEFVDVSKINATSFMAGHIHSHSQNPKYLGSILPNSVAEGKEFNNSVVKMLCKDFEKGKAKERQVAIPSFVSIKEVHIKNIEELDLLEKDPAIFYKIMYKGEILEKSIKTKADLLGINIYSTEKLREEGEMGNVQKIEVEEYKVTTSEDLIKLYKETLNISDEEMSACIQVVKSTQVA